MKPLLKGFLYSASFACLGLSLIAFCASFAVIYGVEAGAAFDGLWFVGCLALSTLFVVSGGTVLYWLTNSDDD